MLMRSSRWIRNTAFAGLMALTAAACGGDNGAGVDETPPSMTLTCPAEAAQGEAASIRVAARDNEALVGNTTLNGRNTRSSARG